MTTLNTSAKFNPPVEPPPIQPSVYGTPVKAMRAKDISGMVSLPIAELFPDTPEAIYRDGPDVTPVRNAAERALAGVDMSMIKPNHRVNVLCSEHGFAIAGGHGYAEMLVAVKDEIVNRTGCRNIKLVVIAWHGRKEPEEIIKYFDFDKRFDRAVGTHPLDAGIEIETVLGPVFGLKQVYNADWIIHTHYDDLREVYAHRGIDRLIKPFGMSYARMETRSTFHIQMGPRSGNIVSRVVADSEFVRNKLAFSAILQSSPNGITDIDADNDLDALADRGAAKMLRAYSKMYNLFRDIEEVIPIYDGSKWPYYLHSGGMIFGNLVFCSGRDLLDLDLDDGSSDLAKVAMSGFSTAIKAIVFHQALTRVPLNAIPMIYPHIATDQKTADLVRSDSANPNQITVLEVADGLVAAVERAQEVGKTDKLLCFDATFGAINCSPSMAEHLLELAPDCSRRVDEDLLPRYLKQRGLNPDVLAVSRG